MKTTDLTGPALDWAVAKAEGLGYRLDEKYGPMCFRPQAVKGVVHWDALPLPYSTDWAQGGPIIDREDIEILPMKNPAYQRARTTANGTGPWMDGPTKLTAAMRCFVASKLGDEVDVPEELK